MGEPTTAQLAAEIVEQAGDAIIFAGKDGVIRLWNAAAERIFGYTADEAVGQRLDLIIPERLRERHWTGWNHAMETGQTRYTGADLLAVPGQRKDGSRVSLEFSIALLKDDSGAIVGVGAVLRDVTERFQRDRELHARLAELEKQVAAGAG
jgi:PAS domain S-box-containing protein